MSAKHCKAYIDKIFDDTVKRNIFSVYVTGGGVSSLQWLFTTPGASKYLKSGAIPYSRSSLVNLIQEEGSKPIPSFCSVDVAERLAKKAYQTTMESILEEEPDILCGSNSKTINIFGVGCTAALATKVPKRGDHRCYVSVYSPQSTITYSIVMDKEALTREEEDVICSEFVLQLIGHYCQLPPFFESDQLEQKLFSYKVSLVRHELPELIQQALDRSKSVIVFPSTIDRDLLNWHFVEKCNLPRSTLVFPGSFNPVHIGHLRLVKAGLPKLPNPSSSSVLVLFEIAAVNVDKPPITIQEIITRLNQFYFSDSEVSSLLLTEKVVFGVAITTTPMFVEKSSLFPNSYFLIGADTLERLLDGRYYRIKNVPEEDDAVVGGRLIQSIATINNYNCKFIIGGRLEQRKGVSELDQPQAFQTLASVIRSSSVGALIETLFPADFLQSINETEFRQDISSSEIRKSQNK